MPGVLQGPQQHLHVGERPVGLRERDATGIGELAHLRQLRAVEPLRERADGMDVGLVQQPGALRQHRHQPGLVERGVGIGGAREARHATGDRRADFRLERRLVLEAGLAQSRGEIDQAGRHDETGGVDDAIRAKAPRRVADGRDPPVGDEYGSGPVEPRRGIDDLAAADLGLHQFPAMMLITAIRTAMPNVTCGRITLREPSATGESISTPRFIGPGCMTIASGFASASFSVVSP